jgi:hypothetical protein
MAWHAAVHRHCGNAAQLRTTAAALSDAHRDAEASSKRALEVRVIAGTLVTTVYCVCPFAPLAPWCRCPLPLGFWLCDALRNLQAEDKLQACERRCAGLLDAVAELRAEIE